MRDEDAKEPNSAGVETKGKLPHGKLEVASSNSKEVSYREDGMATDGSLMNNSRIFASSKINE